MVNIMFINDDKLCNSGTVRKLLDPACGTGGMLAEAQNYLRDHHGAAKLYVFGQDYNKRAFATAASDMLMKDIDQNGGTDNVRYGSIFTDDQFTDPPYESSTTCWLIHPSALTGRGNRKKSSRSTKLGFDGRFGACHA
jgi:type I restriction enzyme M protein